MQLSCVHCGQPFTISVEQLGGTGQCPHCQGEIKLPKASGQSSEKPESTRAPGHWWENSISGLVSIVVHMLLMLILALISYNSSSGEGVGEEVLIGNLPSETLNDSEFEELSLDSNVDHSTEEEFEEIEIEPPVTTTSEAEFALLAEPSALSGGEVGGFDSGTMTMGGGAMAGGSWDGMMQNLRRHGLDIVITFDSTASMQGEIDVVKRQVQRIGGSLLKLVPKARISICTYRDDEDRYVVRGLPLTGDIQEIDQYLAGVSADGGGDHPEAVQEGLRWAIQENRFRGNARKVILLFGDAPPHRQFYGECLRLASDFNRQQKGIVSTVTCRSPTKMWEFEQIAKSGGGEAFQTADEREIMRELLTLVFGSHYRDKVMEAFELTNR